MIARLAGIIEAKGDDGLIVDVSGVGYRVFMSLLTLGKAPPVGQKVKVFVQTVVREDALDLFGFLSESEEALFKLLVTVSHVGPKMAIGILSGIEPKELADAIRAGNVNRLKDIHGVGKKTAERLVVELREKMAELSKGLADLATPSIIPASVGGDLINALTNLGYKPAQAERAAELAAQKLGRDATLEALLREALRAAR